MSHGGRGSGIGGKLLFLLTALHCCTVAHGAQEDFKSHNLDRTEASPSIQYSAQHRFLLAEDNTANETKKHKYLVSNETQKPEVKNEGQASRRKARTARREAILSSRTQPLEDQEETSEGEPDLQQSDAAGQVVKVKSFLQTSGTIGGSKSKQKQEGKPRIQRTKATKVSGKQQRTKLDATEEEEALHAKEVVLQKLEVEKDAAKRQRMQAELGRIEQTLLQLEEEDQQHEEQAVNASSKADLPIKGIAKTEALLRNQSLEKSVEQAEAMVTAHKQAMDDQEKAIISQPINKTHSSSSSRELNPRRDERRSHDAFRDLIMSDSSQLSGKLPKVAMLFLTRGEMPLESTWDVFFESLPLQGVSGKPGWKTLFNVYTHPQVDFSYPSSSLFAGTEVKDRVNVAWGQFSVMAAEIRLFTTALEDPLNERFMLLSETCVPIYPATVVWAELLTEGRSRIDACKEVSASTDKWWKDKMVYRHSQEMLDLGLNLDDWRKTSQWVALTRRHAQMVRDDNITKPIFEKECYIEENKRFCVADEHYIPTMLARNMEEDNTDCMGFTTNAKWDGPYSHPRTWRLEDLTRDLILQLRRSNLASGQDKGPCECNAAIRTAGLIFPDVINVTAVQNRRRRLLSQKSVYQIEGGRRPDTWTGLMTFEERLAVVQPYTSAWFSFLMDNGVTVEEAEALMAQQEALGLSSQSTSSRRILEGRTTGLRHEEGGAHWDLAREFLKDYEAMNDIGCPLFARKFLEDSGKLMAEMATKLGTLEQAFLATEAQS